MSLCRMIHKYPYISFPLNHPFLDRFARGISESHCVGDVGVLEHTTHGEGEHDNKQSTTT